MGLSRSHAPRIIAGRHRGRVLSVPEGLTVRPTAGRMREALFDILEHGTPPLDDARFLDLFSGTGAIGLEALSRGAADVLMIECQRVAAAAARANIRALGEESGAQVLLADATRLGPCSLPFDIIYLDPPYGSGMADAALLAIERGKWLALGGRIVCELAAREQISAPDVFVIVDERRYGAGRLILFDRQE